MNDDQRAVLAAIARMEGRPGTLIDEYTVAREAGILTSDLAGHEFVASPGREVIRRHFGELERAELIRLDRDGFWRPRTTLAGRRLLQGIPPLVAPLRPNDFPEWSAVPGSGRESTERATIPSILLDDDDDAAFTTGPVRDERGWPAWWPGALRVGDPSLTPLIVPITGIIALLICVFVGARVLSARNATPTPTPTEVVAASPTPGAGGVAGGPTGASPSGVPGGSNGPAAVPTPTRTPTPKPSGPPTATAKPQSKRVMIANTDNKGAFVYATPKGEKKTLAIPEGIIVDVVGPDERDSTGVNWKHIAWADGDYWIPEEYTEPAD